MYHWIITLQSPGPSGGFAVTTLHGTCNPSRTRCATYEMVYESAVKRAGVGRANVLFFSLEPDELS